MKTSEDFDEIPDDACSFSSHKTDPVKPASADSERAVVVIFQKQNKTPLNQSQSFTNPSSSNNYNRRKMSQAKADAKKFIEETVAKSQVRVVRYLFSQSDFLVPFTLTWLHVSSIFSFLKKVVVFSKSFCPYCMKTKELLKKSEFANVSVEIFELDKMPQGPAVQSTLAEITGQRTVPSVWVNGEFVGGNDVTQGLYKSGELQNRLKTASVQS